VLLFAHGEPKTVTTPRVCRSVRSRVFGMQMRGRSWRRDSGPLDRRVANQLLAEAQGNPVALPSPPHRLHGVFGGQFAGGFGFGRGALSPVRRIEESSRAAARGACPRTPSGLMCWRRRTRPAIRRMLWRAPSDRDHGPVTRAGGVGRNDRHSAARVVWFRKSAG